jgi:hypothetical protein
MYFLLNTSFYIKKSLAEVVGSTKYKVKSNQADFNIYSNQDTTHHQPQWG